jgi:hypothetical protein
MVKKTFTLNGRRATEKKFPGSDYTLVFKRQSNEQLGIDIIHTESNAVLESLIITQADEARLQLWFYE